MVIRRKLMIERFVIECRKTKVKVITTANQNNGNHHKEPIRTQAWTRARKNASDQLQVVIGLSFASDWLRR